MSAPPIRAHTGPRDNMDTDGDIVEQTSDRSALADTICTEKGSLGIFRCRTDPRDIRDISTYHPNRRKGCNNLLDSYSIECQQTFLICRCQASRLSIH